MRRMRFWSRAVVSGYRWASDVTDHVGRVLLILGIMGVPALVIAVGRYPWWWSVSGAVVVVLFVIGEGAYRTYADVAETARTGAVRTLATELRVEQEVVRFQASQRPYRYLGTDLGFRCTNIAADGATIRSCRAYLRTLEQLNTTTGAWESPEWFSGVFLAWEDATDMALLGPSHSLLCGLAGHDNEHVFGVGISHTSSRAFWPLTAGRWRGTIEWRAEERLPVRRDFSFDVSSPASSQEPPGLGWAKP